MAPQEAAVLILALVSAALAGDVVTDLAAIPGAGTEAWDDRVRFRLLVEYDRDGDNAIDRREVRRIPCDVWTTLDTAIAEEGAYRGLLATYGFRRDLQWIGSSLGFAPSTRSVAEVEMRACGVTEDGPLGPDWVHHPPNGEIVGMLRQLPAPGSPPWQATVAVMLAASYDADGSGLVDTDDEIAAVPCDLWTSLDDRLRAGGDGLVPRYGLREDLSWRGWLIGLDPSARVGLESALATCDVPGAALVSPADASATVRLKLANRVDGGTSAWDDAVRDALVDAWDTDRSGAIDRPEEVGAIGCDTWTLLDDEVRAGGRYHGVVAPYGLSAGGAWVAEEIGLARGVADEVRNNVAACGLK